MTRDEAIQVLSEYDVNFGYRTEFEIRDAIGIAIEALKQEPEYCDRNICIKNEYNGIGCEDCEVTKSQEPHESEEQA